MVVEGLKAPYGVFVGMGVGNVGIIVGVAVVDGVLVVWLLVWFLVPTWLLVPKTCCFWSSCFVIFEKNMEEG